MPTAVYAVNTFPAAWVISNRYFGCKKKHIQKNGFAEISKNFS